MIGILNCTASKLNYGCRAQRLYSASPIFRRNLAFIKPLVDDVFILSAKHYVVHINEVVAPYNAWLGELDHDEYQRWCEEVRRRLLAIKGPYLAAVTKLYRGGLLGLPDVRYLPLSKYGAVRAAYRGVGFTDLARWMAAQGWNQTEIHRVAQALGHTFSSTDLAHQWRAGKQGKNLPTLDNSFIEELKSRRVATMPRGLRE